MKIEAGKFYRTENGDKVGPMERFDHETWQGAGLGENIGYYLWADDGRGFYDGSRAPTLVAVYVDPPTEPIRTFDPAWPYGHVTRDGRKARVIYTNVNTDVFKIVALVTDEGGDETVKTYLENGNLWVDGTKTSSDLFNAPPPKREFWVNISSDNRAHTFSSRGDADIAACNRIACVHVTEGDGL